MEAIVGRKGRGIKKKKKGGKADTLTGRWEREGTFTRCEIIRFHPRVK